jgi:hypothetical protein
MAVGIAFFFDVSVVQLLAPTIHGFALLLDAAGIYPSLPPPAPSFSSSGSGDATDASIAAGASAAGCGPRPHAAAGLARLLAAAQVCAVE